MERDEIRKEVWDELDFWNSEFAGEYEAIPTTVLTVKGRLAEHDIMILERKTNSNLPKYVVLCEGTTYYGLDEAYFTDDYQTAYNAYKEAIDNVKEWYEGVYHETPALIEGDEE